MPSSPPAAQATGGLTTAALAPDRSAITAAARQAQWEGFVERIRAVLPELDPVTDADEINRLAALLQRAELVRMSRKAHEAKRLKARLRKLEAELAAASEPDPDGGGHVAA